ncbi:MAG TPA: type II toxin-antitoxin system HicA family toxin [Candidatus Kapabacteria bacterium]|jgi:predicted RNA binding protein YcfA (HicA-like mRNA interferase family)
MPYKSREVVAKLLRAGFEKHRQQGTSHCLLRHPNGRRTLVAMHSGDVPNDTFRKILKQSGLTLEEFRKL